MDLLNACDLVDDTDQMSVKMLSYDIKKQFHSSFTSDEIMQNISELLRKFGNAGVKEFIHYILSNQSVLNHIAQSSYVHQNGFYKIPLILTDKFTIRLHIWNPKVASKETLHNHRWYLASTILKGTLCSEIWENSVSEQDPLYDEYLYINKNSSPQFLGKVRVVMVRKEEQQQGNAYVLTPNVLHRITSSPQSGMVATLVCRSACVQEWSRNIIVNGLIPNVKPQYMSAESFRSILLLYLDEVNK